VQETESSWLVRQLAVAIIQRIQDGQEVSLLDDEFGQIASLDPPLWPGRRGEWAGPHDAELPGHLATSRIARDGLRSVPFLVEKLLKQPAVPTRRGPPYAHERGMSDPKGAACALLYVVGGKDAARAVALYLLTDASPDRLLDADRLTDEELVDKMIALLPDDTKNNLAAWVLGQLKDARAIGPLVASLTEYHVLHVGRYAAEALARIGEPAVPALGRALCSRRPQTQSWAAIALGKIGAAAIPALEQAFASGGDVPHCQYYVLRAARDIGWKPVPLLERALLSPDPHVRCMAADALKSAPSESARRALLSALARRQDDDGQPLICIAESLGSLKEKRALRPLVRLTADPDWMVRRAGIKGLGLLGDRRATAPLVRCLRHADYRTRGDAAVALGTVGDPAAIPDLRRALKDGTQNAYVRGWAAWALGQIGGAAAVEALIGALRDGNSEVRRIAADVLTTAADRSAVAPLIAALDDDRWRVRQEAATALGNLGDRCAVEPLIAALNRYGEEAGPSSPEVRAYAQALGELRDQRAVTALLKWMGPYEYPNLQAVVEALGKIGDVRAVEPLTAALNEGCNNGSPKLLIAITHALREIGDRRAVEPLIAQLRNWNGAVRQAASGALEEITGQRLGEDVAKWQTRRDRGKLSPTAS